ncbi:MAG: VanZ family protein [Oligoflexia bacterium]|nr:VanZ family protein [Oligoflexia bacterium]
MKQLKYTFYWLLVFGYMGVIFYWSHQPTIPLPQKFAHQDKVMHFFAYFILGFLIANAYQSGTIKKRFWVALTVASLYGFSDEVHQYFIPGRDTSFLDWLADTAGAYAGAALYFRSLPIFKKS